VARRPILVGVSGSAASRIALDWATVRAQAGQTALVVMHAVQWPRLVDPYGFVGFSPPVSLDVGQELLDEAVLRAQAGAPSLKVFARLRVGSPTQALLHEGQVAELIVLGRSKPTWVHGVCAWTVGSRVARSAGGHVIFVSTHDEVLR
jgi:nucleotide-binding universal stress UspA family protein